MFFDILHHHFSFLYKHPKSVSFEWLIWLQKRLKSSLPSRNLVVPKSGRSKISVQKTADHFRSLKISIKFILSWVIKVQNCFTVDRRTIIRVSSLNWNIEFLVSDITTYQWKILPTSNISSHNHSWWQCYARTYHGWLKLVASFALIQCLPLISSMDDATERWSVTKQLWILWNETQDYFVPIVSAEF